MNFFTSWKFFVLGALIALALIIGTIIHEYGYVRLW